MLLSKSFLTAPFILCCGCFERHLLGPWILVPCIYLDLRRNNKSNNPVAQTHLPTAAGLTGPAGRAHAQQAPGVRGAQLRLVWGQLAQNSCPFEAGVTNIWKLNGAL